MSFNNEPLLVGGTKVLTVAEIGSDQKPFAPAVPIVFTADPAAAVSFAVHSDGVSTAVTGLAAGTVTVTSTATSGGATFTDTGTFVITEPPPPPPPTLASIVMTVVPGAPPA